MHIATAFLLCAVLLFLTLLDSASALTSRIVSMDSDSFYTDSRTPRIINFFCEIKCLSTTSVDCPSTLVFKMKNVGNGINDTRWPLQGRIAVDSHGYREAVVMTLTSNNFNRLELATQWNATVGNTLTISGSISYAVATFPDTMGLAYQLSFTDLTDTTNVAIFNFNMPSINEMGRMEVNMYFYNKYIASTGTGQTKPSFDPNMSHAEMQLAAWYNFEMNPRPSELGKKNPDIIEVNIIGTGYFQFEYEDDPIAVKNNTAVCWINSLPVMVELIDAQYTTEDYPTDPTQMRWFNQTVRIYAKPRYSLRDNIDTDNEPMPIPAGPDDVDFLSPRFFLEFTCEDRLLYIYDPVVADTSMLVRLAHFKPNAKFMDDGTTGDLEYLDDRYFIDLFGINTQGYNSKIPRELLGIVHFDPTTNTLLCKATLDLQESWWIFNATSVNIVSGSDGITYTEDPPSTTLKNRKNAVILSILPDLSLYPTFKEKEIPDIIQPFIQLYPLSSTGTGGPFVYFDLLPGLRPYLENVAKIMNITEIPTQLQISVMYHLNKPVLQSKHISCTLIVDALQVPQPSGHDSLVMSYASSQYYNATEEYSRTHTQISALEEEKRVLNLHYQRLSSQRQLTQDIPTALAIDDDVNYGTYDTISSPHRRYYPNDYLSQDSFHYIGMQHKRAEIEHTTSTFAPRVLSQDISTKPNPYNSTSNLMIQSYSPHTFDLTITNPNHELWTFIFMATAPGMAHISLKGDFTRKPNGYSTTCQISPKYLSANGTLIGNVPARVFVSIRELEIGPLPSNFTTTAKEIHIDCSKTVYIGEEPHIKLVGEPLDDAAKRFDKVKMSDVAYITGLSTHQQFVTFYQEFMTPDHSHHDDHENGQIYLSKVTQFSVNVPFPKTRSVLFLVVLVVGIVVIIVAIIAFPLRRMWEKWKDKKRANAVQIQSGGYSEGDLNDLIFEEIEP